MDWLAKAIDVLPDEAQYAASGILARTRLLNHFTPFRLFLESLGAVGADPRELHYAVSHIENLGPSFVTVWSTLGHRLEQKALQTAEAQNSERAAELFRRAALYYLAADWAALEPDENRSHYENGLRSFDRFRQLCCALIEKVDLKMAGDKTLKAHFRIPIQADLPVPALMIFSGSDEPKEWLTPFEDAALKRGLATLSIDLPGFGENARDSACLQTPRHFHHAVEAAVNFLCSRPGIKSESLGTLGLNLGGLFSHLTSGLDDRIKMTASLGAPLDPAGFMHKIAAVKRLKLERWFGVGSMKDAEELFRSFEIIPRLGMRPLPALLVHGMKDEVVPVREARGLVTLLKGSSELKLIPDGDHLCSAKLERHVLPYIFNWISDRLGGSKLTRV